MEVVECNNKQILYVFLFNIRNYSPGVRNIQRREAELSITLPRMNNFDIKQKMTRNICSIIYPKQETTITAVVDPQHLKVEVAD